MAKPRETDQERFVRMSQKEDELRLKGYRFIAGVDEAGRGPLAGPVFCAACILDPNQPVYGLNDSKKLSEKKREILAGEIREKALAYAITSVSAEKIDEINILEATRLGMTQALRTLSISPDVVLTDAVQLPKVKVPLYALVKGDATCNNIAAASILAKMARDHWMMELAKQFPSYGFEKHKGYGTALHYQRLQEFGPTKEHRLTFLKKLKLGGTSLSSEEKSSSIGLNSRTSTNESGWEAEQAVAAHLSGQGYRILQRRYAIPQFGEIDLIAERDHRIYFIEVKARQKSPLHTGDPLQALSTEERAEASLTRKKIGKIRRVGDYYIQSRDFNPEMVILLGALCELDSNGQVTAIHYVEMG